MSCENLEIERQIMPEVSVLMCVFNGERFLAESVESILSQTFRDFEFIIVDDGSTDSSYERLADYARSDERINVIHQPLNLGITSSVKNGLQYCRGKYIARMDQDDISLPQRLLTQYQYLENHTEIDAIGAGFEFIDGSGNRTGKFPDRESDAMIVRLQMLYHCMLHNPSVMMKSEYYKKYNENHLEEAYYGADDYHFWLRMNNESLYSNLSDTLLLYRRHQVQVSSKDSSRQLDSILRSAHEAFESLLGMPISVNALRTFYFINRYVSSESQAVTEAVRVIYKTQLKFESLNRLTKVQKEKTREYSYEKLKSVVVKYRRFPGAFLLGTLYLIRLIPGRFLQDFICKIEGKKFNRSEQPQLDSKDTDLE